MLKKSDVPLLFGSLFRDTRPRDVIREFVAKVLTIMPPKGLLADPLSYMIPRQEKGTQFCDSI